ncbi:MAG: DUF1232 domain-containing protein [Ignavibacteria bacterium]|jgi:uncharacterized membrane protein YkvA (DUF1232 family)|nr:DUF1232 domain-containing protein [Ignavibacteria bacterium]MCU7503235.1 DUF1232 domain-containing protein [Ignavibacteria bacterium]MCU7517304.1 DUF1232 domain-containing protein [Ignavibacteria bacterium]
MITNRPDLDELESPYTSEKEYRKAEELVNDEIWTKLEKTGKRISFARDIRALFNYMRDPYVSWHRKAIVVGALVYFITPIDAIPDLAPLIGYLDDLGVIVAVLKFLGSELIPYYDRKFV